MNRVWKGYFIDFESLDYNIFLCLGFHQAANQVAAFQS